MKELYELYNIKDASEKGGTCLKTTIRKKNRATGKNEIGLFKQVMGDGTIDNVVEALVYRIGELIGVRVCKAKVCKYEGKLGSFSRYEADRIVTFKEVFRQSTMGAEEIICRIKRVKGLNEQEIIDDFLRVLVIDYITGQLDRHLENIAFQNVNGEWRIYNLFDNGLALFSHMTTSYSEDAYKHGYFQNRTGDKYELLSIIKYFGKRACMKLNLGALNESVIIKTIDEEDIYGQVKLSRKKQIARFIMERVVEIKKLW